MSATTTQCWPLYVFHDHLTRMWRDALGAVNVPDGAVLQIATHQPSGEWFTILRWPLAKIETITPLSDNAEAVLKAAHPEQNMEVIARNGFVTLTRDYWLIEDWAPAQTWTIVFEMGKPRPEPAYRRRRGGLR